MSADSFASQRKEKKKKNDSKESVRLAILRALGRDSRRARS